MREGVKTSVEFVAMHYNGGNKLFQVLGCEELMIEYEDHRHPKE